MAGDVISECKDIPDFSAVAAAAASFVGRIEQVPPRVSAVKIGGKRAHHRARCGEDFEIKPRVVEVHRLEVAPLSQDRISYLVECSPGTYVRSLARDIGASLGCGGAVESIRRVSSGGFRVDDAISLEQVSWDRLQEWLLLLPEVACVALPVTECEALLNGRQDALKALSSRPEFSRLLVDQLIAYRTVDGTEPLGLLRKVGSGDMVIQVNVERSIA
jgi:tRNA pseudouridine55 synthase